MKFKINTSNVCTMQLCGMNYVFHRRKILAMVHPPSGDVKLTEIISHPGLFECFMNYTCMTMSIESNGAVNIVRRD